MSIPNNVEIPGTDTVEIEVTYGITGEKYSIAQIVHKKYLTKDTLNDVLEIAQEAHKEMHIIATALGLEYGKGLDPNLEMLCTCREIHKTRVYGLRNVLISMISGTFSTQCHKTDCPSYAKCPQNRDLTQELKVLPEAKACVWYRKQKEDRFSKPYGKRTGNF
ncbi:MAG: hypothetical protein Q7S11_02705 [bacterium]|nr:hypothetical protein [bacterium]